VAGRVPDAEIDPNGENGRHDQKINQQQRDLPGILPKRGFTQSPRLPQVGSDCCANHGEANLALDWEKRQPGMTAVPAEDAAGNLRERRRMSERRQHNRQSAAHGPDQELPRCRARPRLVRKDCQEVSVPLTPMQP